MAVADHSPNSPPVTDPVLPMAAVSEHGSSCSSSDLDTDSDDDFFQIEAPELARLQLFPPCEDPPIDFVANNQDDSHMAMNDSEIMLTAKYLGALSEDRQSQAPAIQMMERNEGVDLGRIPSSVFVRSSPTPMEWSVASNESLFSIHTGSLSFSKDQIFLTGRSGDLGEFTRALMDYPSPLPLPLSMCPATTRENASAAIVDLGKMEEAAAVVDLGNMEEAVASANADAMLDVMKAAVAEKEREREKPAPEPLGRSASRHSDGSNTSFRSFAFPILTTGRFGSTKVDSIRHADYHPLSKVSARKTVVVIPAAATAVTAAAPASTPGPAHSSIGCLWFSCSSCCRFCC